MTVYSVDKLIAQARQLAADYKRAMGKPLAGVSGEIAEYDAACLLDLELCQERRGGYDAIGRGPRDGLRFQIKGRAIFDEKKSGQRIGQLKVDQEWDRLLLVLLDENFETVEIYEAQREAVLEAAGSGASSRRSKRGAMSVARFKNIARLAWSRERGVEEDEVWDNRSAR
ncbi:MAG: hypothetical protein B7Z66_05940 [Chromatiales bacterium 21-64-14]|nr:MAG: hypothetical protein B7Z66_05940 [Chromatiales bacterium 21-64-14]HQU15155.1 hypothetical protein [Gammaproteobacteria bacterium]